MDKRLLGTLCTITLLFILSTGQVSALEGTEIWEEGSSIEYKLDYFQESIDDSFQLETEYDIQEGPVTAEYTGLSSSKMIFDISSDDDDVIDVYIDDPDTNTTEDTDVVEVDPMTGKDQDGDYSYFFHDTSTWEDGHETNISLNLGELLTSDQSRNYVVDGDAKVLNVDGKEVMVFDTAIDDFQLEREISGNTYNYKFSNLRLRLSQDYGVLMAQSFNLVVEIDFDDDGIFDSTVSQIDMVLNVVSISDGVTYNSPSSGGSFLAGPKLFLISLTFVTLIILKKHR